GRTGAGVPAGTRGDAPVQQRRAAGQLALDRDDSPERWPLACRGHGADPGKVLGCAAALPRPGRMPLCPEPADAPEGRSTGQDCAMTAEQQPAPIYRLTLRPDPGAVPEF